MLRVTLFILVTAYAKYVKNEEEKNYVASSRNTVRRNRPTEMGS